MAIQDPKPKEKRLIRIVDWFFGYDYFISYNHGDGLKLPARLQERLTDIGFRVFLDQTDYVPGIDLRRETRRQVLKSKTIVLIGRPGALRSEWVKREVDVALAAGKTPVVLNINNSVEAAPPEAAVAAIARSQHWLRLNETLDDPDSAPSDRAVSELVRSFKHTRQEVRRQAIFAVAAAAFAVAGSVAVWQATIAVLERSRATAELHRAQRSDSHRLAGLAEERRAQGDHGTALLVALHGLPQRLVPPDRPIVPRLVETALNAAFDNRELAWWGEAVDGSSIENRCAAFTAATSVRLLQARTSTTLEFTEHRFIWFDVADKLTVSRMTPWFNAGKFSLTGECSLIVYQDAGWLADVGDAARRVRVPATDSVAALSRDGLRLAIAREKPDGSGIAIEVWNLANDSLEATLAGHRKFISRLAFDESGERLVSTSFDDYTRFWSGGTASPWQPEKADTHITALALRQRTDVPLRVVTGAHDGTLTVIDGESRRATVRASPRGNIGDKIVNVHVHPSTGEIFAAHEAGSVTSWPGVSGSKANVVASLGWVATRFSHFPARRLWAGCVRAEARADRPVH